MLVDLYVMYRDGLIIFVATMDNPSSSYKGFDVTITGSWYLVH